MTWSAASNDEAGELVNPLSTSCAGRPAGSRPGNDSTSSGPNRSFSANKESKDRRSAPTRDRVRAKLALVTGFGATRLTGHAPSRDQSRDGSHQPGRQGRSSLITLLSRPLTPTDSSLNGSSIPCEPPRHACRARCQCGQSPCALRRSLGRVVPLPGDHTCERKSSPGPWCSVRTSSPRSP